MRPGHWTDGPLMYSGGCDYCTPLDVPVLPCQRCISKKALHYRNIKLKKMLQYELGTENSHSQSIRVTFNTIWLSIEKEVLLDKGEIFWMSENEN